jgi:hypothetical protein
MTVTAATLDLLRWIDSREATYDQALEVWKSHCPRLTIWEDALLDGLIRIERTPARRATVALTADGRAALAS